jgi:molecular chaperone GrpE
VVDKDNSMEELMNDGAVGSEDLEAQTEEMNNNSEVETDNVSDEVEETSEEIEEDTETDKAENKDAKGSKSFFKKKEKKDSKDQKIDELNDRLIRTMAEFDNFRKRSEKEKAQMFEIGARDIIEKVLPVIDNFERGLGTISEEEKESAFAQGIEKIYKQLVTTLTDAGLKPIEAVGKEFDPNFHNAVMHAEDPELGENVVSEEFQKGYTYREIVVRHSMVKVVN